MEWRELRTGKLVPSRSVGFRTYLAIVTGGFCTCLAIVSVSAAVFHLRMLHCTGQGVRSQRSKIGPNISQISRYIRQISWRFEIDRPKALKEATVIAEIFVRVKISYSSVCRLSYARNFRTATVVSDTHEYVYGFRMLLNFVLSAKSTKYTKSNRVRKFVRLQ